MKVAKIIGLLVTVAAGIAVGWKLGVAWLGWAATKALTGGAW